MSFDIQIVSDLHLELYYDDMGGPTIRDELIPRCENIALCGDIGEPGTESYDALIQHCSRKFARTYLVLGNHEYYWSNIPKVEEMFANYGVTFKNVYPLSHKFRYYHVIDNHCIQILGCTLWSHVPPHAVSTVSDHINDYRCIYTDVENNKLITVADTNEFHLRDYNYLKQNISRSDHMSTMIFTHHAPLLRNCTNPYYENNFRLSNHAFSTDLSKLFRNNVKLWAFGHTHFQNSFRFNKTRVITNAPGWGGGELLGYDPVRVFRIPLR